MHDQRDDGRSATAVDLSVILPAFNEADGLNEALAEARTALDGLVQSGAVRSYEILIIDDGSADATRSIAEQAAALGRCRTRSHQNNRGVGAALRTGLEMARGRLTVWTDADMPVDLSVIDAALEQHRRYGIDLVAGARARRTGDGPLRWACTVGYDLAVRLALGVRVDDVNFAFKLAPTDLLRSLDLRSEGAFIDAELMALTLRSGHVVQVTAMDYRPRRFGTSSTLTPRTLAGLGREFLTETPRIRRVRRPERSARPQSG